MMACSAMTRGKNLAVPRRAALQTSNQIVVQIAHMRVSSHPELHETIDLNGLKKRW
jgi:hypothetical protein